MEKVGKQGRKRLEWKGTGLEIRMSVEVHPALLITVIQIVKLY